MIGFFTNLFYFQRISFHLVSPGTRTLGAIALVIPIGGGLVVGLMARFGSEQIRGHGIPEAMERILINGSRVQPRLAVLKPISSAINEAAPGEGQGPVPVTRLTGCGDRRSGGRLALWLIACSPTPSSPSCMTGGIPGSRELTPASTCPW